MTEKDFTPTFLFHDHSLSLEDFLHNRFLSRPLQAKDSCPIMGIYQSHCSNGKKVRKFSQPMTRAVHPLPTWLFLCRSGATSQKTLFSQDGKLNSMLNCHYCTPSPRSRSPMLPPVSWTRTVLSRGASLVISPRRGIWAKAENGRENYNSPRTPRWFS